MTWAVLIWTPWDHVVILLPMTPDQERWADLRLRVEGFEHPLDLDAVQALRQRSDYPVTC